MTIVQTIVRGLRDLIQPDLDTIVGAFNKAQRKLAKLIEREEAALERETGAIMALLDSRVARNATIDRAYRVTHKLDQLVA
jgi:hypothetical protein